MGEEELRLLAGLGEGDPQGPIGARLVVVNGAEVVQVASGTLRPVRRLPRKPPRTGPIVAALSPDGRMVALGAEDGTV
jgi:hypothetical protein